ncbi:MAG: hypothetical protein HRU20_26250 [Pseudomonadales bacterium]|nr:hypothetical protein [Pseudomonadales bacterium]
MHDVIIKEDLYALGKDINNVINQFTDSQDEMVLTTQFMLVMALLILPEKMIVFEHNPLAIKTMLLTQYLKDSYARH